MNDKLNIIMQMAEEAEHLLLTSGIRRKNFEEGTNRDQLKAALKYIQSVKVDAVTGEFSTSTALLEDEMILSYSTLSPSEMQPAFKCVDSYKACKSEATSIEDKILCGVALVICFAKEVIPLA